MHFHIPYKGYEGQGCVNINECINGDHECVEHSTCFDNDGSYTCECNDGYEGYGRTKCDDVNECSRRVGECSKFAICIDQKGSYDCTCFDGYEDKSGGTGKVCEDKGFTGHQNQASRRGQNLAEMN